MLRRERSVGFGLHELLDDLVRRPAVFRGPRQKVVQFRGYGAQADLPELRGETIARYRRLLFGRVHRRSPDREAGLRWPGLAG